VSVSSVTGSIGAACGEAGSSLNSIVGLVLWILGAMAAGWVGSHFAPGEWYESLAKPSWNPPGSVFGPVWTVLYVLMGVSAWLVWRGAGFSGARGALTLYLVQLALNALWSFLFFGARNPMIAFFEIVVLWFAILATMLSFWRIRPVAGALLLPYLGWVGFASVLNYRLWRLNA
jgi:tryptophan-rich sensory protein